MMIETILAIVITLTLVMVVVFYQHFKTVNLLKDLHKAQLRYIYKNKYTDAPPTKPDIEPDAPKRKAKVYNPSQDTHAQLTGEIIDPFD